MRSRKQRNWDEATEALGCAPLPTPSEMIKDATEKTREMTKIIQRKTEERRELLDRLERCLEDE